MGEGSADGDETLLIKIRESGAIDRWADKKKKKNPRNDTAGSRYTFVRIFPANYYRVISTRRVLFSFCIRTRTDSGLRAGTEAPWETPDSRAQ